MRDIEFSLEGTIVFIISIVIAIVVTGIIAGVAWFVGRFYTALKLRTLRNASIQRTAYETFEDISPAEFGVIVEGRFTFKNFIAEVLNLHMKRLLDLQFDHEAKVRVSILANSTITLSPSEQSIMSLLGQPGLNVEDGAILLSQINTSEYQQIIAKSLEMKGWVFDEQRFSLTGAWNRGRRFILRNIVWHIIAFIALMPLLGIVFAILISGWSGFIWNVQDGLTPSDFLLFFFGGAIMEFFLVLISPLIIVTIGLFTDVFRTSTVVARNQSPKYQAQYNDVLGLHTYLTVSGMDTMTPDYVNLEFKDLDKLYPYAVSIGLDNKIVQLLSR